MLILFFRRLKCYNKLRAATICYDLFILVTIKEDTNNEGSKENL